MGDNRKWWQMNYKTASECGQIFFIDLAYLIIWCFIALTFWRCCEHRIWLLVGDLPFFVKILSILSIQRYWFLKFGNTGSILLLRDSIGSSISSITAIEHLSTFSYEKVLSSLSPSLSLSSFFNAPLTLRHFTPSGNAPNDLIDLSPISLPLNRRAFAKVGTSNQIIRHSISCKRSNNRPLNMKNRTTSI